MSKYIKIDDKKCKLCGGCVSVCPVKVLFMHETFVEVLDDCINCKKCIVFCPVSAIEENNDKV